MLRWFGLARVFQPLLRYTTWRVIYLVFRNRENMFSRFTSPKRGTHVRTKLGLTYRFGNGEDRELGENLKVNHTLAILSPFVILTLLTIFIGRNFSG